MLIGGQPYDQHLIVSTERIIPGWTPPPIDDLQNDDFRAALDLEPEVILFGTGATHQFAGNRLITTIMSRGIGFEVMPPTPPVAPTTSSQPKTAASSLHCCSVPRGLLKKVGL